MGGRERLGAAEENESKNRGPHDATGTASKKSAFEICTVREKNRAFPPRLLRVERKTPPSVEKPGNCSWISEHQSAAANARERPRVSHSSSISDCLMFTSNLSHVIRKPGNKYSLPTGRFLH